VISALVREPVRAPWTKDFSHGSCRLALAKERPARTYPQPHYWHTSGESFGDSIENGRLIYLMFFMRGQAT
jgi:hypothetical protein